MAKANVSLVVDTQGDRIAGLDEAVSKQNVQPIPRNSSAASRIIAYRRYYGSEERRIQMTQTPTFAVDNLNLY